MSKHPPSSIGAELGWLAFYLGIFSLGVFLMLKFVAPHHFNDRIGILIVAIVSAVGTIGLRARSARGAAP